MSVLKLYSFVSP